MQESAFPSIYNLCDTTSSKGPLSSVSRNSFGLLSNLGSTFGLSSCDDRGTEDTRKVGHGPFQVRLPATELVTDGHPDQPCVKGLCTNCTI